MIVKDEERCLERCLDSVKDFVDEIIIIDTGSVDNTKDIAKRYTKNVFDFTWNNNFSDARNFSLSKATKDWILALDADEILDDENKQKIASEIHSGHDAILLTQRNYRNDKASSNFRLVEKKDEFSKDYVGYTPNLIIRIFKNNERIRFEGNVHETVGQSIQRNNLKVKNRQDIFIHHYLDEGGYDELKKRQLVYLKIAEERLREEPNDPSANHTVAAVCSRYLKDYEKSLYHMKAALKNGYDKNKCLMGIGSCLYYLKRYDEAEKTLIEVLKNGYSEPDVYYLLHLIYQATKEKEKELIVLTQLSKMDSRFKEIAIKKMKLLTQNQP